MNKAIPHKEVIGLAREVRSLKDTFNFKNDMQFYSYFLDVLKHRFVGIHASIETYKYKVGDKRFNIRMCEVYLDEHKYYLCINGDEYSRKFGDFELPDIYMSDVFPHCLEKRVYTDG